MTFRTDQNNNPTACTTDVAHEGGLVFGTDYIQGDSFKSGTTTLFTAKLLGNPIYQSIKLIDKATFYTHVGQPRWAYISIPMFIWDSLSVLQKTKVIGFMYQHEGGEGLLHFFNSLAIPLVLKDTLK